MNKIYLGIRFQKAIKELLTDNIQPILSTNEVLKYF